MHSWFWSLVWRLHHWDVALSYRIALRTEEGKARPPYYWVALAIAHLGDSWLWVIIAGLCFRKAWVHRHEDAGRRTNLIVAWMVNVGASTVATLLIKRRVRRTRPGRGRLLYGGGPDVHSFPSGHAARLSTIAIWSNQLWPGGGWFAWPLLCFVGWSRVVLGIHYAGDVIAGTVLGSLLGMVFRKWRAD